MKASWIMPLLGAAAAVVAIVSLVGALPEEAPPGDPLVLAPAAGPPSAPFAPIGPTPAAHPSAPAQDFDGVLRQVQALLSAREPSAEGDERLAELREHWRAAATRDAVTRARLIDFLRNAPGSPLGQFALSVLEQLDEQDVLDLGLELTRSQDRDALLAGLAILSQQGGKDSRVAALAQPLLSTRLQDPQVLVAAIDALAIAPASPFATTGLVAALSEMLQHPDPAVRSAGIFAVTHRAQDSRELAPVIEALQHEDPEDRISASMALEQSEDVSDALQTALVARMTDPDELWEVRRAAADSLGRFSLSEERQALVSAFRQEQERVALGF